MSNPEDEKPQRSTKPISRRSAVAFLTGPDVKNRPSPLARMMLNKAHEALLDGEYGESLDDLMTIKSIEEHADIDAAIAITALSVIQGLELDERAQVIGPEFVSYLTAHRHEPFDRRANELRILGQIFHHKRLIELRNEANRLQSGLLSSDGDGGAHEIINELGKRWPLRHDMKQRDPLRRETGDLWSALREIGVETRRLRKLVGDQGRARHDLRENTNLVRMMLQTVSGTADELRDLRSMEDRALQALEALKTNLDVLTAKQDRLRKQAKFSQFFAWVNFAALGILLIVLSLRGILFHL